MDQTYKRKIRLLSKNSLDLNVFVTLNFQETHYLKTVMRCNIGNVIYLFNEIDGEYEAKIIDFRKKMFVLKVVKKSLRNEKKLDLHLIFAPVKKEKTEYIVQKATELGVSKIIPVYTDRTIKRDLNIKRLSLIAKEASEQCERISIPKIIFARNLMDFIEEWDSKRSILYADETMKKKFNFKETKLKISSKGSVLIGPEGGFSETEIKFLKSKKFVLPISLGPRVLRSDTAAIVVLTYWFLLNSFD